MPLSTLSFSHGLATPGGWCLYSADPPGLSWAGGVTEPLEVGSDPPAPAPVGHARWAWLSRQTPCVVERSLLDTWNTVFREVPRLYLAR